MKLTVLYVTSFHNAMREAHNRIRESTHSVARTHKTYFDKHAKAPRLQQNNTYGTTGHVLWFVRKTKRKTQIWTGPWKITQFVSPLVVKIQHIRSNKTQTVHIDRSIGLSPSAT